MRFAIYCVLMLNIGAVRNIKNSEEKLVVYCHSTMLFFMCVFLCISLFGSIFILCLILLDRFYGMETKTMLWVPAHLYAINCCWISACLVFIFDRCK